MPHSDLVVVQTQVVKKRNNTESPIVKVVSVTNQATSGTSKSPYTKKYKGQARKSIMGDGKLAHIDRRPAAYLDTKGQNI